jgi:uncharacterized protein
MRTPKRFLRTTAIAAGIAYMVVFALLYLVQNKLLYHIDPVRTPPAAAGLAGVGEFEIAAADGVRLIAWHAPARPGQPTLLYFHGQGGTLNARSRRFQRFMGEGWGVYMMTWRGYGGSTGSPSEANNVADAGIAYDALRKAGVEPRDIVLYGESLGSGIAVQLATQREAAGVILDAPYTSTVDVAADRYPFFPVRLAMRDTYQSSRFIKDVRIPVLILHGEKDAIIPVQYGKRLYEAANQPKQLKLFLNGGHTDLYYHGALETVRGFLAALKKP